jgi:carbonic anhydrase
VCVAKAVVGVELRSFQSTYYKFMGSLTTPPCSEKVKWHVYKTEMTISKEQVKAFYNIFKVKKRML